MTRIVRPVPPASWKVFDVRPVRERLRDARWPVILPILVYAVLALTGTNYSSIGIDQLRETPGEHDGIMLGTPLTVRSDEWATSTPALLRVLATGATDDLNPLTADDEFLNSLPSGPVSTVVLLDRSLLQLGPWLPDHVLYSATLWLPLLLLALSTPAWFARITGSSRIGWFAFALLVLCPLVAWWSFGPLATLGPLFAGCVALLKAHEAALGGRRLVMAGWTIGSALLLARTLYGYQPWSVVLGSSVLAATVAFLLVPQEGRRRAVGVVAAAGAATLAALGAVLVENRATLAVLAETVYPGQRRADGLPSPLQDIFAAPALSVLQDNPGINGSNASEISSSFGVALVWFAVLTAAMWRPAPPAHRSAVIVLGAATALWFAWSTLALGTLASSVPLLSMVPQARAADVVGMLGVVLVCLVIPLLPDLGSRRLAVVAGVATGATTAYAASLLRLVSIPTLSLTTIYLSSAVVALAVFAVTLRPRRPHGYVVAVVGAALLVWNVNPLLVGLADLRGSTVADDLLADAPAIRADGEVWATDAYAVDSLLAATGVPSLSGRQLAGPDTEAWEAMVPDADQALWNRGGAFVWFQWVDKPGIAVSNPSADVIVVQASPCTLAERVPAVRTIVATRDLDLPCLRETDRFDWGGSSRVLYEIRVGR